MRPDERDGDQCGHCADGQGQAPPERTDAIVLAQEEAGQHGNGEQTEADRGQGQERGPEGADAGELGECGVHGDGFEAVRVALGAAEDVLVLLTTTIGLRQAEGQDGHDRGGYGDDQEGPLPAVAAPGDVGDRGDQQGAEGHADPPGHRHRGPHPAPGSDRVLIGEQRALHGQLVGAGGPEPDPGQEHRQRGGGEPGDHHQDREDQADRTDDPASPAPIGQPAHGQRRQHHRDAGHGGQGHHGAGTHAERPGHVGGQAVHGGRGQPVEGDEQGQDDEWGCAPGPERVTEGERFPAHARNDGVGQVGMLVASGLALGLEIEDQAGQRACAFFLGAQVMLLLAPGADDGASWRGAA